MNPEKSFGIYHDLYIDAPLSKVYEAITLPEHLINWWPLKCSGQAEIGAEYNFNFTDKYDWYGIVHEFALNHKFQIKMTKSDPDWDDTIFGFDLKVENQKVLVSFFHEGWAAQNSHFRISSFCWAMLLNGLKSYLENGLVIPFEKRN